MYTDYWKSFNSKLPQKQAKIYEIDLGQTNGPYKEELLLRYGDHVLNKMMTKLENNTGNFDKEDIKQMNEKLRPYQERSSDYVDDNLVIICNKIENKINDIELLSNDLKYSETELDKKISEMTTNIFNLFDQNYKEFNPKLIEKYKILKQNIKEQKDESANLNKQIDFLKQEMDSMKEKISKLTTRVMLIEDTTGLKIDHNELEDEDNYRETFNNSIERTFKYKN